MQKTMNRMLPSLGCQIEGRVTLESFTSSGALCMFFFLRPPPLIHYALLGAGPQLHLVCAGTGMLLGLGVHHLKSRSSYDPETEQNKAPTQAGHGSTSH